MKKGEQDPVSTCYRELKGSHAQVPRGMKIWFLPQADMQHQINLQSYSAKSTREDHKQERRSTTMECQRREQNGRNPRSCSAGSIVSRYYLTELRWPC